MPSPKEIAPAGATGRVGHHAVGVLQARGHAVVPMSRSQEVDIIAGKGLTAAMAGVDCVIDAAPAWSTPAPAAPGSTTCRGPYRPTDAAADVLWLATLPAGTREPYGELVQHRKGPPLHPGGLGQAPGKPTRQPGRTDRDAGTSNAPIPQQPARRGSNRTSRDDYRKADTPSAGLLAPHRIAGQGPPGWRGTTTQDARRPISSRHARAPRRSGKSCRDG